MSFFPPPFTTTPRFSKHRYYHLDHYNFLLVPTASILTQTILLWGLRNTFLKKAKQAIAKNIDSRQV